MFSVESAPRFQRLQIANEAERQQQKIQLLETEGQLLSAAEFTHSICPTCADDALTQPEPSGLQTKKPQRAPVI